MASGRPSRFNQLQQSVSVLQCWLPKTPQHLQVKGRVGHVFDDEADGSQSFDHVVPLVLEGESVRVNGLKATLRVARLTRKCFCRHSISLRTRVGSMNWRAASWKGWLAPPSKKLPQEPMLLYACQPRVCQRSNSVTTYALMYSERLFG